MEQQEAAQAAHPAESDISISQLFQAMRIGDAHYNLQKGSIGPVPGSSTISMVPHILAQMPDGMAATAAPSFIDTFFFTK